MKAAQREKTAITAGAPAGDRASPGDADGGIRNPAKKSAPGTDSALKSGSPEGENAPENERNKRSVMKNEGISTAGESVRPEKGLKLRAGFAYRAGEIFRRLGEAYPGAGTALVFRSPFELLVAAILSAQCTDTRVNIITARLFKKYRSSRDFAGLTPEALAEEIKDCGLHHSKSRYIIDAARAIQERHGGEVPSAREELEALPGVGRKTAGVVLGVAFGADTLPVDTHVFRVARRLGLSAGKGPGDVEKDLLRCFPPGTRQAVHHRLIRHGREICMARRPRCGICPLADACPTGWDNERNEH